MIDAMAAKYRQRSLFIEHPYTRRVADIRLTAIRFKGSRPLSQIQIGRLSGCRAHRRRGPELLFEGIFIIADPESRLRNPPATICASPSKKV